MRNKEDKQHGAELYNRMKPFLGVIVLQFGLSGMDVLSKAALNEGMNNYVFVVYCHAFATVVFAPLALILDKKMRPKMTISIFTKIVLLSILEPVIDQNLYILGIKYTTATYAAAMSNILPAVTFLIACILRLEKVKIKRIRSQAKIAGTAITFGGAMLMTLIKGPVIDLIWTKGRNNHQLNQGGASIQHPIMGSVFMAIGCFSWACFMNLQAITLKTYPAELSLTTWICLLGTAEGAIVALIMERGNPSVWSINWGITLLTTLYSGIICSGLTYYVQGVIMKDRGPVFVTAFSPLNMVIVAVFSSFILAEQMYLGRVIGAIVIVAGLYLVVWGKSNDYETPFPLPNNNEEKVSSHDVITINTANEVVIIAQEQKNGNKSQATELMKGSDQFYQKSLSP